MSTSAIDVSTLDRQGTVLAWSQTILENYSQLSLLPPIQSLDDEAWHNGLGFLCLSHCFFPDSVPDFLNAVREPDFRSFDIFKAELNIQPPALPLNPDTITAYLSDIRNAIDARGEELVQRLKMTQAQLKTETYQIRITRRTREKTVEDEEFERRATLVLNKISQLRTQLNDMTLMATAASSSSRQTQESPSKEAPEDDLATRMQAFEEQLSILNSHDRVELETYVQQMPENSSAVAARMQAIDAAYSVLQLQLQEDFEAIRENVLFSELTTPIRDELEYIQAKMLKTATSEESISDLETRAEHAGKLLDDIAQQHHHTLLESGKPYCSQFDALRQKHRLICSWVNDVRVWFTEAEKLRHWMEERIKEINAESLPDALDEEIECSQQDIEEWMRRHEALEKQLEIFDKEDMTRLRAHVKALTGSERRDDKDLSPADTTTIEITFTTLMVLDKLLHRVRQRSYNLQMLNLRSVWEQEHKISAEWVMDAEMQVSDILHRAQWKKDEEKTRTGDDAEKYKNAIVQDLLDLEQRVAEFDQGQFTTMVNMYQEIDDTSKVELPAYLESRQVAVEEALEELSKRLAFVRQVVEQRLSVQNFVYLADALKVVGEQLRHELTIAEETAAPDDTDFTARVRSYQEDAVELITNVSSHLRYPHASHLKDEASTEEANETARNAVGARTSYLILFAETLDHHLKSYRNVLELKQRADQLQDDINALNNWTESKLLSLSKTPVDVLAKDNLPDLQRLQSLEKETEVLAGHAKSARKDRLDMLRNELQILTTSVKTSNATAVKTDVLKENLQQLAHKVDTYNDRLSERAVHIDLMKLRHAWNKEYSAATQALNMAIQEAWNAISRLQWSQANISDQDDQVKSLLEYVMKARDNIKAQDLEAVSKAFAAFKENIAEKLPGVVIPDYMIQHQTGLDKLLQTLDTIIEYAHAVAEQRSAIEQFNGKVQHLLERGQALMKHCETATDNVMSSKENDRKVAKDVDVLVQQFEEDVNTLWTLVDNEIPYPVCPKDAWETRPYIYGNKEAYDTNEGVRQYISEQREHLSALIMQLRTLSDQHSQAAQLANTVHQILKEIQETNAKISNLSTSIKSDRPDLLATELPLSPAPDSNAELQKRAALYEEDIDKLDLPGIRAKCHEVEQSISNFRNKAIDPSIVTTALATLENRASELSRLTKEHKRYLEAFESRIKWEQVHKQASKTADEAQSKLRAVSDELDIFISKDLELVGKEKAYIEELGDQVDQESKPLLSALSQELIPSLRKAYQDMNEQYQGLDTSLPGTLEECQNELLALEPALIEKEQGLQEKLKQLLLRIEWQHAAQQASKRSLDIEQDIEAFINNEARWIPGKTAATKQKDLEPRQKQLQDIVKSHSDTVFKLLESRDQMLLNSTVLETISNKMTEKTEVLKAKIEQLEAHLVFAGQVIQQHVAINEYLDQATMLDEEADKLHKELAASNALDPDEISRFKQKVDDFCNQPAVPCPVRDHDPRYNSLDKSANASVSETVAARQAKLKELVVSLEMASKAKEEAKAAVDSYLQDAQTVQGWIQPRLDQVQKIISQLPSNNSDPDILGESLTAIKAIRSAIQAYGGAFASLKRKSEALLEESKPEVQETQEQVSRLWQELLGHSENAEKRLESSLHAAEFKQQVDEFGKELIALQEQLKSADISTVTDEQIAGWRKQVQNLKVRRVDAIASQCKTEGDKVECRRIQQEHAQLKDALQDLVSQVHQDRLHKEYHSRTESVKAFANNILAQLGKLRSQYLDVAADEEDHRSKAQEFVDAYHDIKQIVKKESAQLVEEQRSFCRFLQHQGVQLQETQTRCDDLVNDMQQKLADTGVATQIVTQWHTLHMNLNNLLRDMDGVANSIQESAEVSSLEEQTSTLTSLAERLETTRQSAEKLVAAPQGSTKATVDAFYAHHGEIEKQLKRLEQVAAEKQQEIEKQRALQENLDAIKAIKESAQQESIAIREYIETLGDSLTNGQTDAVESQYRQAVARHHASDEKYQELSAALEAKADDGLKDTDAYKETSNALSELKGSIEMEKSTHDYLRRMVGHVKSANSVMLWIQNCRNAMDNLETQMNLAEDRDINTEIDDIAQRMQDFDRFLRSFNSMTDALLETEDINGKLKHAVKTRTASIWSAWEELERQLEDLKVAANKMTQGVAIVRQVKAIMTKLGETRDQISSIRLPDNEPDESPSSPLPTQHMALSDLLREPDALAAEKALSGIESGARSQLDAEVQRLDNLLGEYGESNSSFEQQRAEVDAAVANLYGAIAEKRKQVALALAVGRCVSTTDDTEILLSALEEAVNKAAPHRASIIGGNFSKTDVQTRYIELDARYKYYEQKIVESLDAAQVAAEDIADCPQKRRVLKHIEQLQERAEKVDRLAKSRRDELVKVLESAADPQPVITSRIRKSSLPTRKASQFLREREKSPSKLLSSINDNNSNSSSSSNNSSSNSPKPSTSLPRPSPRYLSANQLQNRTPRLNQQLTVPGERPQLRQPSKSASNLKQPSIKVSRPPPPNKYVADPDNDLDMEIGRIVNETPYKVKVKMVPGEVGRYWFGDVNPKLAYCRVLKSKMVMVRVGGGWMELSEFLRDHALLEGDFIPKARATEAPPTIQEGFIETEQRRRARSPNPPSLITAANINASRSAPQNNNQQQHLLPTTTTMMRPTGYMDGDRYIAVDKYGNELEVKMTRAGSRDYSDSRSSSISHRRRRVPRRHPTSSQ